jgi:ubiquinone/menaquinone biosynthesis C-methylase UbiE
MTARRDVRSALKNQDANQLRQARQRVHLVKEALGERGPTWWSDAPDYNRHLVKNTPYHEWYESLDNALHESDLLQFAPDYDAYQSSFHTAFRRQLYAILDQLPLPDHASVLDVPCGNGFYSRRFAERLGMGGRLVAADKSVAYLGQAQRAIAEANSLAVVEVIEADAYRLPFPDATFDLVWCAQSLISLDPAAAVREMYRVVKPDGLVAILEVDEFHHVLLSWPEELEAALPQAMLSASVKRFCDGGKLSPTRRLRRLLQEYGFRSVRRDTYPIERAAPFDPPTLAFLTQHFQFLRSMAYAQLSPFNQSEFDRLTNSSNPNSLFRSPDSELVCINAVYYASPNRV